MFKLNRASRQKYALDTLRETRTLPPVTIETHVTIREPNKMSTVLVTLDAEPEFVSVADIEEYLRHSNATYALQEWLALRRLPLQ